MSWLLLFIDPTSPLVAPLTYFRLIPPPGESIRPTDWPAPWRTRLAFTPFPRSGMACLLASCFSAHPSPYLFCYLSRVSWGLLGSPRTPTDASRPSEALMVQRARAPFYSVSDVFLPCLFLPPSHLCSLRPAP